MRKQVQFAVVASLALFAAAPQAAAQVFTPSYLSARPSPGLAIFLSDSPGDVSVEGAWRGVAGSAPVGLRVGVADTNDLSVLLGGEIAFPIARTAPVDLAVTGAAQATLGGVDLLGAAAGLAISSPIAASDLRLTPYLHPRVAIADYGDGFSLSTDLLVEIGAALAVSSSFDLLLSAVFGDGSDLGFGITWR